MTLIKADSQEWYVRLDMVMARLRVIRGEFKDREVGNPYDIKELRDSLESLGVTLEYIGTSERELENLRIKGCKNRAMLELEVIRHTQFDVYIDRSMLFRRHRVLLGLHREIGNGCLTLEEIGTSRKELMRLWFRYYKALARSWLFPLKRFGNPSGEQF